MGRAGRFSPFNDGMKTHLVANFMWRTTSVKTSVKQANLKLRNRLSYYCQLFALFWVMPVRVPLSLTQIQGARTPICAGRLQWSPQPRHCDAKADSHSRFRALPQPPGWRQEPRPGPMPEQFPAARPPPLMSNHTIDLYIPCLLSHKWRPHIPIKSQHSAITVEPASGMTNKNEFGRCTIRLW